MFGAPPAEVQRQIALEQEARAMRMAQLDPMQEARFRSLRAGQNLGQLGAGMLNATVGRETGMQFGAPPDPRLQEAQRLDQVKQEMMRDGVDPKDIDTFYPEMIQRLQRAGLIEQSLKLQEQYQRVSNQQDAIEARKSKSKETALEAQMPGLKIVRNLASSLKEQPGNAELIALYEASIKPDAPMGDLNILKDLSRVVRESKASKDTKVGTTEDGRNVYRDASRGEYVVEMRQTPDGLQPVKMFGNYRMRSGGSSTTVEVKLPNDPKEFVALRDRYLSETKDYTDKIRATGESLTLFQQAKTNPTASEAFRNSIARAFRSDGQVSQKEVDRLINAGALPQRVGNTVKRFLFGTITDISLEEAREAIASIRAYNKSEKGKIRKVWNDKILKQVDPEVRDRITATQDDEDIPGVDPDKDSDDDVIRRNLQ
jgi:hypothetical protein